MMYGNSIWESTLQRHVPAASLSRVSSYDWLGSMAFFPLGLIVWGPVAEAIGISAALWSAFGLFAIGLMVVGLVPEVRRLPAMPDGAGRAAA